MQSALVVPSSGVPRAKLIASSQQRILAVAHHDGSISIFNDLKYQCAILNPYQSVCFMRIVRDSLLVGFTSGLFAKYCIYTGHLKVYVQLDFEVRDCLVVESSILLVGDEPQMVFVQRKNLEIERAIPLPAVPIHVTKYGGIAVVYSNGHIDFVDEDSWELIKGFSLPTKKDKGGVEEPLIGVSVLPNGQWVIIRRNTWNLYEMEGDTLVSQFESVAVCPFNYCVPDALGVLVVCDDEKIVLIESNNVQVINPIWPLCTLAGVGYLETGRCAFLHDLTFFVLDNKSGQWKGPSNFATINSSEWCVSEGYMSSSVAIKRITDDAQMLELKEPVSFLHVEDSWAYAGLVNGTLAIIDISKPEWRLEKTIYLLNSAITGIHIREKWISVWSNDTVGVVNRFNPNKFHVVPICHGVKFAFTQGNHLRVSHSFGHQEWDLETGMIISGGEPEHVTPKSFCTWRPMTIAPISNDMEEVGLVYQLNQGISVAIISTTPTVWSAPFIYTLRASQGSSLAECVEGLRENTSIGVYEDFVVHASTVDPQIGRLAASMLTALWSPSRLNELENSAGARALVVLNAVYPLVPVGDWLRKQLNGLLEGSRSDRLLALQLLTRHPDLDLCPFPFKAVEATRNTCTANTFISAIVKADVGVFNDVMAAAAHQQELAPTVLYCLAVVANNDVVKPQGDNLVSFIDTIVRCLPVGKAARDLLATIYWKHPHHVLFNRKKQKVLVVANTPPIFAVLFDLRKGSKVELEAPESELTAVEFVEDGNGVEASSASKTYRWNLAAGLFSMFKRQARRIEPENCSANLVTKKM